MLSQRPVHAAPFPSGSRGGPAPLPQPSGPNRRRLGSDGWRRLGSDGWRRLRYDGWRRLGSDGWRRLASGPWGKADQAAGGSPARETHTGGPSGLCLRQKVRPRVSPTAGAQGPTMPGAWGPCGSGARERERGLIQLPEGVASRAPGSGPCPSVKPPSWAFRVRAGEGNHCGHSPFEKLRENCGKL